MGDQKIVIWAEACALLEQAERLQRQFFRPYLAGAEPIGWEPPVDVYETDRELRLLAALPGVGREDLTVSIAAGELVIRGVRRFPVQDPHAVIHRLEVPHGRFERRLRLPGGRFRLTQSELVDGCLVLTLTKEP